MTAARAGAGDRTGSDDPMLAFGVVVRSVVGRPWLAPAALAEGLRLARPGWWRQPPFLPLPDRALWHFRMETAYGGTGDVSPPVADVRSFLHWCSGMRDWRK
ncbi:MAG TPA: hypothetical protein VED63_05635 [Acidimicrobiales bacterium]|nr:hypothetical protein [Acidimicrobiales bacterium]